MNAKAKCCSDQRFSICCVYQFLPGRQHKTVMKISFRSLRTTVPTLSSIVTTYLQKCTIAIRQGLRKDSDITVPTKNDIIVSKRKSICNLREM